MEFFELIRIDSLCESLGDCLIAFIFCSFLVILVSFAGLQTYFDIPEKAHQFKVVLISAGIAFGLSVFIKCIIPDSTSYYLEAKYKLYHEQTLSSDERDNLLKQVDKLIDKRVSKWRLKRF